jgi:hypothetical protein
MCRHVSLPIMKSALIAILFCVCVPFTFAGDFHTELIAAGGTLTIPDVPANHFLRIRNFTQDTAGTRGTVQVTIKGTATTVLTAAIVTNAPPENINSIVIAGPATNVTVKAGLTATTTITYIKQHDSD